MVSKAFSTADAISSLLGAADPEGLLSCRDAVRRIRSVAGRCELTDNELVDLVVLVAMRRQVRAISFDLDAQAQELRPVA